MSSPLRCGACGFSTIGSNTPIDATQTCDSFLSPRPPLNADEYEWARTMALPAASVIRPSEADVTPCRVR